MRGGLAPLDYDTVAAEGRTADYALKGPPSAPVDVFRVDQLD